ncbi:leucine-rich repeat domain-containing protein [Lacunimicrobium album]
MRATSSKVKLVVTSKRPLKWLWVTLASLLMLAASLMTWQYAQLRHAVALCEANSLYYVLGDQEESEYVGWLRLKIGPLPFDEFTELRIEENIEEDELRAIFRHAPRLKRLGFRDCSISPKFLSELHLPSLESLSCTSIDLSSFDTSLFLKFERLEKLSIHYCNLRDVSCEGFNKLSNLKALWIDELNAGDEAFTNACKCPNLEEADLQLQCCKNADFTLLKAMPKLKKLRLNGGGTHVTSFDAISDTPIADLWLIDCILAGPIIPVIANSNCVVAAFSRCIQLKEYREILPKSFQNNKLDHIIFSTTNVTLYDSLNLILRFDMLHEIYMPRTTTWDQTFASYSLYLISHAKELYHLFTP